MQMTKSVYLIKQLEIYFQILYLVKLLDLTTGTALDKQSGKKFSQWKKKLYTKIVSKIIKAIIFRNFSVLSESTKFINCRFEK